MKPFRQTACSKKMLPDENEEDASRGKGRTRGAPLVSTETKGRAPAWVNKKPFVDDVVQVPRRSGAGPTSSGPDPKAKG